MCAYETRNESIIASYRSAKFYRSSKRKQLKALNSKTEYQKQFLFIPRNVFISATNAWYLAKEYEIKKFGAADDIAVMDRALTWHDFLTRKDEVWDSCGWSRLYYSNLRPGFTVSLSE